MIFGNFLSELSNNGLEGARQPRPHADMVQDMQEELTGLIAGYGFSWVFQKHALKLSSRINSDIQSVKDARRKRRRVRAFSKSPATRKRSRKDSKKRRSRRRYDA